MRRVGTAAVFDDVGIGEVRDVEMGQCAVVLNAHRCFGAVEHGGVKVGNLEVEGR